MIGHRLIAVSMRFESFGEPPHVGLNPNPRYYIHVAPGAEHPTINDEDLVAVEVNADVYDRAVATLRLEAAILSAQVTLEK